MEDTRSDKHHRVKVVLEVRPLSIVKVYHILPIDKDTNIIYFAIQSNVSLSETVPIVVTVASH